MSAMEHIPHCLAMEGPFVCNRDLGHIGAHESRGDRGSGCIGWAPSPDESHYAEPSREVRVLRALGAIETFQRGQTQ